MLESWKVRLQAARGYQAESINHNKFGVLSEINVNEIGLKSETEDGSIVKINDYPVPKARADFSRKPRMPKLPPRKSQFMRMGCDKSCDVDFMSNGELKSVIGGFEKHKE